VAKGVYSVCEILHSNPESAEYGTVDGVIFHEPSKAAFQYSIVFLGGEYHEFQAYPCVDFQSFQEVIDKIRSQGERLVEGIRVLCREHVDKKSATDGLRNALNPITSADRSTILKKMDGCFSGSPR
jgi:hypothetical protein